MWLLIAMNDKNSDSWNVFSGTNMYTYLKFGLPRVLPPGEIWIALFDQYATLKIKLLWNLILIHSVANATLKIKVSKCYQITSGKEEGLENSSGYDSTDEEVNILDLSWFLSSCVVIIMN